MLLWVATNVAKVFWNKSQWGQITKKQVSRMLRQHTYNKDDLSLSEGAGADAAGQRLGPRVDSDSKVAYG